MKLFQDLILFYVLQNSGKLVCSWLYRHLKTYNDIEGSLSF